MKNEQTDGCLNCKHKVNATIGPPIRMQENGLIWFEHKEIPRHCGIGNDEQYIAWWTENGHKIRGRDEITGTPCFEPHDSSKSLDNLLRLIDEMKDIFNREIPSP